MKPDSDKIPLISCLCVTQKKPAMLNRVIRCFDDQTYENKQLIIVYEDFDILTHEYIVGRQFDKNVKIIQINTAAGKIPLGGLRNISVREADGQYVTQWDDDDWFDSERLSTQMDYMREMGKEACLMSRWIVFDSTSNKAYVSYSRLWEGSILCSKDIMQKRPYPEISKGEDSSVIETLFNNGELAIIDDMPHLYVYTYHGNNTWEREHFEQIFRFSAELPESYGQNVLEILNG